MILVAATQLAACNGWPKTIPFEQAEHRPEKYQTYTATPAESLAQFYAGNHRYMVMPGVLQLRSARMAGVQAHTPFSVFALQGDEAPYSVLFARTPDGRMRAVAPID
jgi:hypothetical protein